MSKYKGYGAKKLIREFPGKGWSVTGIHYLLQKLWDTRTSARQPGSGQPRTVRTEHNVDAVQELVLSHKDIPKTHQTMRQIERETGIHRSSDRCHRIVHKDLRLICLKKRRAQVLTMANCTTRLTRAKKLLRLFPTSTVDFIFFTDEKVFTLAPPVNLQNDRVYVPASTKKRDVAAERL